MATYISEVNHILRRLNEVPLSDETWDTAENVQAVAQDAVDTAVRELNQAEIEWPFNHHYEQMVLTIGQSVYSLPTNTKTVDWESFFVKHDPLIDAQPAYIRKTSLDQYNSNMRVRDELNLNGGPPLWVFPTQGWEFAVTPRPDKPYTITFEWWGHPDRLVAWDDTINIPENYLHIVRNGAMAYLYDFRGDYEVAGKYERRFRDGVSRMRTHLINRNSVVWDGRTAGAIQRGR